MEKEESQKTEELNNQENTPETEINSSEQDNKENSKVEELNPEQKILELEDKLSRAFCRNGRNQEKKN